MSRWEELEEWLFDHDTERFSVYELAESKDLETPQASGMIQSYLAAQRQEDSTTLYVLKREGRTRSAIWSVGQRVVDARAIGQTLFEDVSVKVKRAYAPDLKRIAERNPRTARYAEAKIDAVLAGALTVLKAAVDGYGE